MKKKMLLWLLGAIVFTAASVNVGMNLLRNTPERDLMLANVEALAEDTEGFGPSIPDYYNKGIYTVTRDGNLVAFLSAQQLDSIYGGGQFASDVVLVTYHNDCVWHKGRRCYYGLLVSPPFVMYQRQ